MTGDGSAFCDTCRRTQAQTGKITDCGTCEGRCPDLAPENADAWGLLIAAQTQMRTGGLGVLGFDYLAIRYVASVTGVDVTPGILRKIQAVERHILNKQGKNDGGYQRQNHSRAQG